MKKFFVKLLLISTPIIGVFIFMELCLRSIPNDYSYKNEFLEENASKLDFLFFGSSHAFYGVNPEYIQGVSFNASHISQSIDYDFEIFKKYKSQLVRLKTVVIPIDYFTFFSRTSTGLESWRVKNYEIYYHINKSYQPKDHSELITFRFSSSLKRVISFLMDKNYTSISCSKFGYGNPRKQKNLQETGKKSAKNHTLEDKSFYTQNRDIIEQFISYAKQNEIEILFYTSPAFHTYTENLNKEQLALTLKTIKEIVNQQENCSYLNFLEDSDFIDTDFRDASHLNKNGARKFSNKLNLILNN